MLDPASLGAPVAAIVEAFEGLRAEELARLDEIYAPDASFRDPFHDVHGRAAIQAVFAHMFRSMQAPRFVVLDAVVQGRRCVLTWDLHFTLARRRAGEALCIHGASHLTLGEDGRIVRHRDYWDAAEELYAKLPLIGPLMRWLQRRAAA